MEKHLVLVNKKNSMVESIIIVDSFENINMWETELLIPISDEEHNAILYGSWNGKKFLAPTEKTLIDLGVSIPVEIDA